MALGLGPATGVGTTEPAPSEGMGVGGTEGTPTTEDGTGVGNLDGDKLGTMEGTADVIITHVCVEYALVLSVQELPAHEVAAHGALKGTVDVVDAPVQVALAE